VIEVKKAGCQVVKNDMVWYCKKLKQLFFVESESTRVEKQAAEGYVFYVTETYTLEILETKTVNQIWICY